MSSSATMRPGMEPAQVTGRAAAVACRRDFTEVAAVAVLAILARLPWVLLVHGGPTGDSYFYTRHVTGTEAAFIDASVDNPWACGLWHYSYWVLGGVALVLATRRRLVGAGLALLLVAAATKLHGFVTRNTSISVHRPLSVAGRMRSQPDRGRATDA